MIIDFSSLDIYLEFLGRESFYTGELLCQRDRFLGTLFGVSKTNKLYFSGEFYNKNLYFIFSQELKSNIFYGGKLTNSVNMFTGDNNIFIGNYQLIMNRKPLSIVDYINKFNTEFYKIIEDLDYNKITSNPLLVELGDVSKLNLN